MSKHDAASEHGRDALSPQAPELPSIKSRPEPVEPGAQPADAGSIPEPQAPSRPDNKIGKTPVDNIDNAIDGSEIEGRKGDYLFTVGNVSSGKSTLQSFLVHRVRTDRRLSCAPVGINGNTRNEAYLNGWIRNIEMGLFPDRTKVGSIRDFTIRVGQNRCPWLEFSFIEIAGEGIRSIVPSEDDGDRAPELNELLERYLREPGIRKRFLFVSDSPAVHNGQVEALTEDILFNTLLRYLLRKDGIGLRKVEALFVAAKWDEVSNHYNDAWQYFQKHFRGTIGTLGKANAEGRVDAGFAPFSVGKVSENNRITYHETKYIDRIVAWVYQSFTNRRLKTHPSPKPTRFQKFWTLFAGSGGSSS